MASSGFVDMGAGNGGRFYRGPGAHRAGRSCRAGHPSEAIRALAYRHTAAAVARLRLSARPRIGIRMTWSTAASTSPGRPWASLPRHPGDPSGEQPLTLGGEQVGRVRGDVGGQGPVAGGPQRVDGLERLPRLDHRQVEQRTRRGAHALGVRRDRPSGPTGPRRGPRPHRPRGSGRRRCPGRTSHGRARPGRGRRSRRRRRAWPVPSDRPQRLPAGSEPRPARRTPSRRPRAAPHPTASAAAITSSRRSTQPSSTNTSTAGTGGQGLADRLRTLGQEHAPRTPVLRHRELTGVANARRPSAQDGFVGGHARQHVRSPPDVACAAARDHVHGPGRAWAPPLPGEDGAHGPTGSVRRPGSRPAARRARSRPARRTPPRRSRPARPACDGRPRHQRP